MLLIPDGVHSPIGVISQQKHRWKWAELKEAYFGEHLSFRKGGDRNVQATSATFWGLIYRKQTSQLQVLLF